MENIQVALRLRPLNNKEGNKGEENIWNINQNNIITLSPNTHKDLISNKKINPSSRVSFPFDYIFSPGEHNHNIYDTIVKRIALSSLQGINGTIFMYGQTGSGKTYTMMGCRQDNHDNRFTSKLLPLKGNLSKSPNRIDEKIIYKNIPSDDISEVFDKPHFLTNETDTTGILILALRDIFSAIENDLDKTYFLRCSYVEIYNDQIYDLLKSSDKLGETLSINEDVKKEFYIKGVIEESVSSISDILDKLKKGELNRHYAATTMNHVSSRSHTIFRLSVQAVTNNFIREYRRECFKKQSNINNNNLKIQLSDNNNICGIHEELYRREGTIVTESLLNFVDLAGSEKVSNHHMMLDETLLKELPISEGTFSGKETLAKSVVIKERVKEGQHINKSLFFLTQVISLKSEGKSLQHIPYRNSPLTKILRSSLGGNSRTLIIICITPTESQLEQSMSTLRFGMNAKKIENKVQANILTNNYDEALKILLVDYEKKIKDFEINRLEDQQKYNNLMKQIDELQLQKSRLIDRLNNTMKLKLSKLTDSLTQNDLKDFQHQKQDKLIYFNKVGLLFSSTKANISKKSISNTANVKHYQKISSPINSKLNSIERSISKRYEDNDSCYDGIEGNDLKDDKDLQFDIEGKNALTGMRLIKNQNTLLVKKINILEDALNTLNTEYLTKYNNLLDEHKTLILFKQKNVDLKQKINELMKNNTIIKKELDLLKDLKGIEYLTDEELLLLEKNFLEKIDKIKSEKVCRQYKKEINHLKYQLNLSNCNINDDTNNTCNNEEEDILKDIVDDKLQDQQQELINIECEEIIYKCKHDDIVYNNESEFERDKEMFIKQQKQVIMRRFNDQIEGINQQIEQAIKVNQEYLKNLINRNKDDNLCKEECNQKGEENKNHSQKKDKIDDRELNSSQSIIEAKNVIEPNSESVKSQQRSSSIKESKICSNLLNDINLRESINSINIYTQSKQELNEIKNQNHDIPLKPPSSKKLTYKQMSPAPRKKNSIGDYKDDLRKSIVNEYSMKENTDILDTLYRGHAFKLALYNPVLSQYSSNSHFRSKRKKSKQNDLNESNSNINKNKSIDLMNSNTTTNNIILHKIPRSPIINNSILKSPTINQNSNTKYSNIKEKDISPIKIIDIDSANKQYKEIKEVLMNDDKNTIEMDSNNDQNYIREYMKKHNDKIYDDMQKENYNSKKIPNNNKAILEGKEEKFYKLAPLSENNTDKTYIETMNYSSSVCLIKSNDLENIIHDFVSSPTLNNTSSNNGIDDENSFIKDNHIDQSSCYLLEQERKRRRSRAQRNGKSIVG